MSRRHAFHLRLLALEQRPNAVHLGARLAEAIRAMDLATVGEEADDAEYANIRTEVAAIMAAGW